MAKGKAEAAGSRVGGNVVTAVESISDEKFGDEKFAKAASLLMEAALPKYLEADALEYLVKRFRKQFRNTIKHNKQKVWTPAEEKRVYDGARDIGEALKSMSSGDTISRELLINTLIEVNAKNSPIGQPRAE